MPDRRAVEKAITAALRDAIGQHGPIDREHVGSAAKRVYGTLLSGGHLSHDEET